MEFIFFIIMLILSYFIGTFVIEKKHYTSILEREKMFLNLPAVTSKTLLDTDKKILSSQIVYGSVVVSIDYFKNFFANLKNIVGGEVSSFESVIDRSRREAILRMKESAPDADIILNMRIETSNLGSTIKTNNNSISCSEVLAYGTAITFEK